MHLSREPNPEHGLTADTGGCQHRLNRFLGSTPPNGRVLFAPKRLRGLEVVLRNPHRGYRSILGNKYRLGGGGRNIDSQYVHLRETTPSGTLGRTVRH